MMQAPRGDLSSGMLAVTRLLMLKRTCLTGCLQPRQRITPYIKKIIHINISYIVVTCACLSLQILESMQSLKNTFFITNRGTFLNVGIK